MAVLTKNELGQQFEQRVARLLRSSTGYRNVREQQHLSGVNVDIIFQKPWNPHRSLTIGVECKNWKSRLARKNVQDIYLNYKPLLDSHTIDELWIISPYPVHATVQEYSDALNNVVLLHINELEQDIIDFSLYAGFLQRKFHQDRLAHYYIPARLEGSTELLHDHIHHWLASDDSSPVAIWAGYGMGKTSYATFLASELAAKYLADSKNRIPIVIPLGDFYTAPRIDGLFANVLTNESGVHGYNFNSFWNLHEAGRFVIILDGFDEMKHAMTKAEFASISQEIRKLILPNSKIILLGRPDAVVSGEEHDILIRGTRKLAELEISDNIAAQFEEVRMDFFSRDEYLLFLRKYIGTYFEGQNKSQYIEMRIKEIEKLDIADILKRPVQARMLAQILLNPKNVVEKISKYELYNMFIEECLSREDTKHERKKTDHLVRRRFMQDLAWWLWAIKRTRTFTIEDIPSSLTQAFVAKGEDRLGALRELLVGSVVEERSLGTLLNEKSAGNFYFPHLSFTEFLVADYLINRELKEDDYTALAQSFEGEVQSFLFSYPKTDACFGLYSGLRKYQGTLPINLVIFLASSKTIRQQAKSVLKSEVYSPWQFAIEFFALLDTDSRLGIILKCVDVILSEQLRFTVVAIQILLKALLQAPSDQQQIATIALGALFRCLNVDKLAESARAKRSGYRISTDIEQYVVSLLSKVTIDNHKNVFAFDAGKLYAEALDRATNKTSIVDPERPEAKSSIKIRIDDIRKSLRNRHDFDRFDRWLETRRGQRACFVFE